MRICLKTYPAKFYPNPIYGAVGLGIFEDVPTEEEEEEQQQQQQQDESRYEISSWWKNGNPLRNGDYAGES